MHTSTRRPLLPVSRQTLAALALCAALPCMQPRAASTAVQLAPADTRTVALAFLQRCADGDLDGAYAHWAIPDYVQHNPEIPDGVAGHRVFFEQVESKYGDTRSWANVTDMLLVDGQYFATLHHVFRSPQDQGRLFFDLWRVEDGHIVEHWDVIQPMATQSLHNNGVACGIGESYHSAHAIQDGPGEPVCGRPDPRASRARTLAVVNAYLKLLDSGDVRTAIKRWFSPEYRQHSPTIADGAKGALDYLEHEHGHAAKVRPQLLSGVRTIAEGDLVMMHRLVLYPGAKQPSDNVDIFRVTDGKVSEHWDIKQPVPSTTRSGHPVW